VAESHSPAKVDTTLICGFLAKTLSAPLFRSVSTEVPATPVTRMMLPPLSPSLSTRNCASSSPNFDLVGVDLDAALLGDGAVERHHQDVAVAGLLHHAVETGRGGGVDDDRVDPLRDQVGDLLRLLGHVVAELKTVQSARSFQPSDSHTDVKSLTISTRHLLPM
jgi:hypothetical protein